MSRTAKGWPRRAARGTLVALIALLAAAGCKGGGTSTEPSVTGSSATGTPSGFDFGGNSPRTASAVGDSITQGVLELKKVGSRLTTRNSYPAILQGMLQGLDPAWRVINRGVGGEKAEQGARRLPSVLTTDRPGFVLLMEGTNNATAGDDPAFIVAALESMVLQAQGNKSIALVATLPPNFRNDPTAQDIING
jgi:lysophospholipase L1-like esterase